MLTIWVARLLISKRVADKIREKHALTPAQVRQAIVEVAGLEFSWDFESTRGLRAIVNVQLYRSSTQQTEDALVVLYPTDNPIDQAWRLGSAYFTRG